jgi:hypothetical protein
MFNCQLDCDNICNDESNWGRCRTTYAENCSSIKTHLGNEPEINEFKKNQDYAIFATKSYCNKKQIDERKKKEKENENKTTYKGGKKHRKQKRRNTKKKRRNHKK